MKKIFTLIALLSMFCSGAWADLKPTAVVNCDFSNGETLFNNASRITASNSATNKNLEFVTAGNSTNGYSSSTYSFGDLTAGAAAVRIEFAYWIANNSCNYDVAFIIRDANVTAGHARNTMGLTGAFISFGRTRQSSANFFSINHGKTAGAAATNLGLWCKANVYIDLVNKKVSYTISNLETQTVIKSANDISYADANAVNVSQIDFFACVNNEKDYMDNLVITKYADNSTLTTSYTVNYLDEELNPIKTSVNYTAGVVVGGSYSATDMDLQDITVEGQKYIYKSGNEQAITAVENAEENVINLIFRKANDYTYSISSSIEGFNYTGSVVEGENVTVEVPRYINVDGTLYETSKNGNDWYRHTFTANDNINETIQYTATNITNVVFYSEGEDLEGATKGNGNATRTSMGLTGYGTDLPLTNLAAGKYEIHVHGANGNSAARKVEFKIGEEVAYGFSLSNGNNNQDFTSPEIKFNNAADITVTAEGSSASGIDYLYITCSHLHDGFKEDKGLEHDLYQHWTVMACECGDTIHVDFEDHIYDKEGSIGMECVCGKTEFPMANIEPVEAPAVNDKTKEVTVDFGATPKYNDKPIVIFGAEFLSSMGAQNIPIVSGRIEKTGEETPVFDNISSNVAQINTFTLSLPETLEFAEGEYTAVLPQGFFIFLNDEYDFSGVDSSIAEARMMKAMPNLDFESAQAVSEIRINFSVAGGVVTKINSIETSKNGVEYNLAGQITKNGKGIVIVNGKKLVK